MARVLWIKPITRVNRSRKKGRINKSHRGNVDCEEYYKKAEEPLTRLLKNPGEINELKRVQELDKMIANKDNKY